VIRTAQVHGKVEYRLGDGPLLRVPAGPITIDMGDDDVTLSWAQEQTRQSAALPRSDFARYVAARAIVI
jgi:hypothetical protein